MHQAWTFNKTLVENREEQKSQNLFVEARLNSPDDDKCPFAFHDAVVFASNRPGGYGGFDLYYSIYQSGEWLIPVNMGEKVNSPFDEYRPIVKEIGPSFQNDMLIFSSNRPNGKGGFDLYYTGFSIVSN